MPTIDAEPVLRKPSCVVLVQRVWLHTRAECEAAESTICQPPPATVFSQYTEVPEHSVYTPLGSPAALTSAQLSAH